MSHIVCSAARHWWQHHAKVTVCGKRRCHVRNHAVYYLYNTSTQVAFPDCEVQIEYLKTTRKLCYRKDDRAMRAI